MLTLRAVAFVCLSAALTGCSFIDDFGRFRGARELSDAGLDAGASDDEDGGRQPEDDAGDAEEAGAGDEAGIDDAGEVLDGAVGADGGVALEAGVGPGDSLCTGKRDGTSCGDGQLICRKGFCRVSRCGDGFVDMLRQEQCDDSNATRGDGCEPGDCHFSCETHAQCDNGYVCDGEELCDVQSHTCMPDNLPVENRACQTRTGLNGVCKANYCSAPGCGDGVVALGEECDPASPMARPGCRADCTQGCQDNAACNDSNVCNGSETCDTTRGECKPGTALVCADQDACSSDGQCAPGSGCVFPLIDSDGDGVSEQTCAQGSSLRGGDCDGTNPAIYPGATEYCDGRDNDCDGSRDEGAVMATCYPDLDADGYPDRNGAFMDCACPARSRLARADGAWDCWDDAQTGGDVHPAQDAYFGVSYERSCADGNGRCASFDYNCDGSPTPLYPSGTGSCGVLGLICSGDGYNGAAPPCGEERNYLVCEGGGLLSCGGRSERRRQVCR